jgi:hypothetical protein
MAVELQRAVVAQVAQAQAVNSAQTAMGQLAAAAALGEHVSTALEFHIAITRDNS